MLLELHLHTDRYSPCSCLDPLDAVVGVRRGGLHGLVITEHHYLWPDEELGALKAAASLDGDFVLLAGQEVDTDVGHVLVLGAERTIARPLALTELRRLHPAAALVWAHPFRDGALPVDAQLCTPLVDAVEILNSNQTDAENDLGLAAWRRLRLRATGGSDAHAEDTVGRYPTVLERPVTRMAELVGEIRAGRCHPASTLP